MWKYRSIVESAVWIVFGFFPRTVLDSTVENMSMYMLMIGVVLGAQEVVSEQHVLPFSPTAGVNSTVPVQEVLLGFNGTDSAVGSRISTILRDLPTIKNMVICICVLTTLLITCLLFQMYRSGKKIRKTRKYDIITTPAEHVEMAPLNEDNEDDEDSTLFDVKYS